MTRVSNNLLKDAGTTGKALLTATTAAAARTTLGLATVASTGNYNDLINKPSGGSGGIVPVYHYVELLGNGVAKSFYGVFPNTLGQMRAAFGEGWNPPTSSAAYLVSVGGVLQRPGSYDISFPDFSDNQQGTISFEDVISNGYMISIVLIV